MKRLALVMVVLAWLVGCTTSSRAPVVERTRGGPSAPVAGSAPAPAAASPATSTSASDSYTVKRGDTLYSIALDNGHDYREIAAWNGLSDPNVIREGQVLTMKPPPSDVQVRPIGNASGVQVRPLGSAEKPAAPGEKPGVPAGDSLVTEPKAVKLPYSEENLALLTKPRVAPTTEPKPATPPPQVASAPPAPQPAPQASADKSGDAEAVEWSWPTGGRVLAPFSDPSNKGLDLAGRKGDAVQASAPGRVVYIGEGLRGYGKLVIIKHNDTFLSAYAHNDTILVKEGQTVTRGQKIAEVGSTGTDQTKLHFEIRRQGKPVDPMKFLPDRKS